LVSGFAWFFLLALRLLLSGRLGAITSACPWRMFPSHLGVARSHLSITRSHLLIMRHFVHRMGPVSRTSGSFAGMHFGLVSPSGSLISGLKLVPVCFTVAYPRCLTCSCSLTIMFSY